jgi:hypothetical protein
MGPLAVLALLCISERAHAYIQFTVMTLTRRRPTGCTAAADASGARRHPKPSLWGSSSGGYTTVGSDASGTERGTKWLTEHTCTGTLIRVTQGVVTVDDLPSQHLPGESPAQLTRAPGTGRMT